MIIGEFTTTATADRSLLPDSFRVRRRIGVLFRILNAKPLTLFLLPRKEENGDDKDVVDEFDFVVVVVVVEDGETTATTDRLDEGRVDGEDCNDAMDVATSVSDVVTEDE
jgi:hypothetical protein